ncbi:MAG: hypothetical protein GF401_03555 [Chitinivibrionales bacterium]|nr:hypothetical protein [Chitinivibrionales bacterium]
MYAYIAGPLYNEGDRWVNELLDSKAQNVGFTTYSPHRDLGIMSSVDDGPLLFKGDLDHLNRADVIIANLNGVTVDAGTSWEIGYAYARNKHIIGVHTDERVHVRHSVVNLMVLNSLDHFSQSIDDFTLYLQKHVRSLSYNT